MLHSLTILTLLAGKTIGNTEQLAETGKKSQVFSESQAV